MSRQTNRDGRLARLYLAHSADSVKMAQLLCGDRDDASARADSAFIKSIASFRDLRNPLTFETSLRRSIIRECRPSLTTRIRSLSNGDRGSSEEDGSGDQLSTRFNTLSHRKKAALVLRYFERLSDDQVADVLSCSTGTARTLVNRALTDLQGSSPGSNPARVAGEVVRFFERRSIAVPVPLEPDQRVLKRAAFRRRLVVGVLVVMGAAVSVLAVILVRSGDTGLSL